MHKDLEKRKAYAKAYYEANKEKSKAYANAYYEANKEKSKAQQKAYQEANKEKIKERRKAYYETNKEKIKAYYETNKEKIKARVKAYKEANKEKIKAQAKCYSEANKEKKQNYFLMRKYGITLQQKNAMAKNQRHLCWICGKKKPLVVDHDHRTNKVRKLLCVQCNLREGLINGMNKKIFLIKQKKEEDLNLNILPIKMKKGRRYTSQQKIYARNYYTAHKEKILRYKKEYAKVNKEKLVSSRLKTKYGISLEQKVQMEKDQNYLCYICGRKRPLVVDHDHKTNKVRNLLCIRCNIAEGILNTGYKGTPVFKRYVKEEADLNLALFPVGV